MYCQDFIQKFEDHYMSYKWSDIQVIFFNACQNFMDNSNICCETEENQL